METNIRSAFVSNSVSFQHNMYSINPPHIIKHNVSSSYFINMKVKTCDAFIKLIKEPANLNNAFCYSTWLEINVLTRHEISRLHNISNLILHYIIYFPAAIFIFVLLYFTQIYIILWKCYLHHHFMQHFLCLGLYGILLRCLFVLFRDSLHFAVLSTSCKYSISSGVTWKKESLRTNTRKLWQFYFEWTIFLSLLNCTCCFNKSLDKKLKGFT